MSRAGYVDVSAAVCLLLLATALTPRSAAAPTGLSTTETMERRHPWENPCDYTCMTQQTSYERDMAKFVANQAENVRTGAEIYRDEFRRICMPAAYFEWTDGGVTRPAPPARALGHRRGPASRRS
ncbi:hypothetical protein EVAR_40551_1 [Eumeta japonica]|uniref:Uncharacterized protein n=1 Tax=Eumeta variegata TaxID=151549 RepID=A0A4C1VWD1_EUMVA|nr:hypothetical protein EVAR_40551_1 [Eumeta japonica]